MVFKSLFNGDKILYKSYEQWNSQGERTDNNIAKIYDITENQETIMTKLKCMKHCLFIEKKAHC